ncbi:hypothetical protein SNE40_014117 [Patella caerulea]|uniref:Zinc finger PHD-type domain-containing protein n=2 Tax=Patella caerulea TaxID=87958 RepID=A0AAN8PC78_PATCE
MASLGKAKSRVMKALPKSPRKRASLVKIMACEILDLQACLPRTRDNVPSELEQKVVDFYESDSVSRMMPGKADFISLKDQLGNKYHKQKRHLVTTLTETYKCFLEDNPTATSLIGKSKFSSLRPRWVLLSSQMPQNVCGCKYHNNIVLLLESLHRRYPTVVPLYSKTNFTAHCVCDVNNEKCMSNNCSTCCDGKLFEKRFKKSVPEDKEFSWYQWEDTDGFVQKVKKQNSSYDAFDELALQLPKFFWHSYIKDKQVASYKHTKSISNGETSEECLLQMDFAENFTCIWQDEIQSAHWKQRQVTVYTVMITYRNEKLSYVITSDNLSHDKNAVAAFTSIMLDIITETLPTVKKICIWTDGPSSQYKNKYIFTLLAKLQEHHAVQLNWNFFATSHGKGPNDGIGGNVKRIVHRLIMARAAVVYDAQTFTEAVKSSKSQINILSVTDADILQRCHELEVHSPWTGLQTFPGTISTHYVRPLENGSVELKFYTSDPESRKVKAKYIGEKRSVTDKENRNHSKERDRESRVWNCNKCGWGYGDKGDPKLAEDWIMCQVCKLWLHESCGETYGILGDGDQLTCSGCL